MGLNTLMPCTASMISGITVSRPRRLRARRTAAGRAPPPPPPRSGGERPVVTAGGPSLRRQGLLEFGVFRTASTTLIGLSKGGRVMESGASPHPPWLSVASGSCCCWGGCWGGCWGSSPSAPPLPTSATLMLAPPPAPPLALPSAPLPSAPPPPSASPSAPMATFLMESSAGALLADASSMPPSSAVHS